MATTYEAKDFAAEAVSLTNFPGVIERASRAHTLATGAINDVVKFFKLPVNAKILGGSLLVPDLDTNATPTITLSLQVTDGTTTKTLISASTIGQAGGYATEQVGNGALQTGWQYFTTTNQDFYVRVLVAAAAATFATGDIKVTIRYTLRVEAGEAT